MVSLWVTQRETVKRTGSSPLDTGICGSWARKGESSQSRFDAWAKSNQFTLKGFDKIHSQLLTAHRSSLEGATAPLDLSRSSPR